MNDSLCAVLFHRCTCAMQKGHTGPHICNCEGSWKDDGVILAFPKMVESGPYAGLPLRLLGLPDVDYLLEET